MAHLDDAVMCSILFLEDILNLCFFLWPKFCIFHVTVDTQDGSASTSC